MAVSEYKTVADQNTTISGINIAEGCPPSGINNAIRQLMADIKAASDARDDQISDMESDLEDGIEHAADGKENEGVCLPKAGGTMTGNIAFDSSINNASVYLSNGGSVQFHSVASDGNTQISCKNAAGTGNIWLVLKPDGTLSWGGSSMTVNGNNVALANAVLPLSGGSMTGIIQGAQTSASGYALGKIDNGVRLKAGEFGFTQTGAYIDMHKVAGDFTINANNGSNTSTLSGTAAGELKWKNNRVITSADVVVKSASSYRVQAPSGGTWSYLAVEAYNSYNYVSLHTGTVAGGSYVNGYNVSGVNGIHAIFIRTA